MSRTLMVAGLLAFSMAVSAAFGGEEPLKALLAGFVIAKCGAGK